MRSDELAWVLMMLVESTPQGLCVARRLVALVIAFVVSACGGGGGNGGTTPPPPPPPPPATVNPSLSIGDAVVTEGDAGTVALRFTVQACVVAPAGATIASASVDYSTSAGTATEGVDYQAASDTVQIPGGTSQVTIDIDVIGDEIGRAHV